jgi:hypothetical protein
MTSIHPNIREVKQAPIKYIPFTMSAYDLIMVLTHDTGNPVCCLLWCRLGKLLVYATFFGTLAPALTVAAALSLRSPFLTPFDQQVGRTSARISNDGVS